MERRKFTREFKLEAVKLVKDRGVSYARAAEDLGVHPTQLRNWVKALADDPEHSFPGKGQMKPEQSEIARLKREVRELPSLDDTWLSTLDWAKVRSFWPLNRPKQQHRMEKNIC